MELTEKQIQKIRDNRNRTKRLQSKFLRKEPSRELLDSMTKLLQNQGLFYKVFLYYESLKKKFTVPTVVKNKMSDTK